MIMLDRFDIYNDFYMTNLTMPINKVPIQVIVQLIMHGVLIHVIS